MFKPLPVYRPGLYTGSSPIGAACAAWPARIASRPPSVRPPARASSSASPARNRIFPTWPLPSMLNSSKIARSPSWSMACTRLNAGFFRFRYPQKPTTRPQARCAVVAPNFIWNDAVPVGADKTHDAFTRRCFSFAGFSTRAAAFRSRCARTSARTVVDLPEPAPPVRTNRSGFVSRRLRVPQTCSHSARSRAFCSTTSKANLPQTSRPSRWSASPSATPPSARQAVHCSLNVARRPAGTVLGKLPQS